MLLSIHPPQSSYTPNSLYYCVTPYYCALPACQLWLPFIYHWFRSSALLKVLKDVKVTARSKYLVGKIIFFRIAPACHRNVGGSVYPFSLYFNPLVCEGASRWSRGGKSAVWSDVSGYQSRQSKLLWLDLYWSLYTAWKLYSESDLI